MTTPSYASGPATSPLLGETISKNLRRTVESFPDREAPASTACMTSPRFPRQTTRH
jgi:fatty-acyl-CoA synthase